MERNIPDHKKVKAVFFSIGLFLPLFILLFLCFLFFRDVYRINNISHAEIHKELSEYLDNKETVRPRSFEIFGKSKFPSDKEIKNLKESHFPIYVFGASSVVNSDGLTFHKFLEKELSQLNPGVRVLNFGKSGITSFEVKQRVIDVFEKVSIKPKLIILYLGHNDYNNSYQYVAYKPYVGFEPFLKVNYYMGKKFFCHKLKRKYKFRAHAQLQRPKIFNLLQKIKLIKIRDQNFAEVNDLILSGYKRNITEILSLAAARGIPVIIMTVVGNLHAEPYGNIEKVSYWYKKGLAAKDYKQSIEYLTKAKDAEMFTFSIRAKSDLNNYLRTLEQENVHVLDLERILTNEGFGFDSSDFKDYVHFNEKSHKIIADHLYEFIKDRVDIREVNL